MTENIVVGYVIKWIVLSLEEAVEVASDCINTGEDLFMIQPALGGGGAKKWLMNDDEDTMTAIKV